MSSYATRLIGTELIAYRTMAFHFEKPGGFAFRAGQAIDLVLPTVDADGQPARHAFSLVNDPDEERLTIATRVRGSPYKEALRTLPLETAVGIDGPFGSLTLHKNSARDAVLIAGGIGITPFVSILRQAARQRDDRHFVLLYSNRRPEDAPFQAEFEALARSYPSLTVISMLTQTEILPPGWRGYRGKIDGALLGGVAARSPIYYVAGPLPFVEAMQGHLRDNGVDDEDIRSEGFYGY